MHVPRTGRSAGAIENNGSRGGSPFERSRSLRAMQTTQPHRCWGSAKLAWPLAIGIVGLVTPAPVFSQLTQPNDPGQFDFLQPGGLQSRYERRLEDELLNKRGRCRSTEMLVIPAHGGTEWSVHTVPDASGASVVVSRVQTRSLYRRAVESTFQGGDRPAPSNLDDSFSRVRPTISTSFARISIRTFAILQRVWRRMISVQRSYPGTDTRRDGTTYYFSTIQQPCSRLRALARAPGPTSSPAALVQVGELLAALADAPEERRHQLDESITRAASQLLERIPR